jgi:hypothetical protein
MPSLARTGATDVLLDDQKVPLFVAFSGWTVMVMIAVAPLSSESDVGLIVIPVTGTDAAA